MRAGNRGRGDGENSYTRRLCGQCTHIQSIEYAGVQTAAASRDGYDNYDTMTIQRDPLMESEIRDPVSRESHGRKPSAYIRYIRTDS